MATNTLEISPQTKAALSNEVIAKRDVSGPRYTSYPTADRFVEAFDANDLMGALAFRSATGSVGANPISIYIHIPFCESLCYYCACNKVITKQKGKAHQYLEFIELELNLLAKALSSTGTSVVQLHLGGGSPTFLSDEQLTGLVAMLSERFRIAKDAENSIEVDLRTVTHERLALLKSLGFNRLSFGVQDFNETVQKSVHRVQPFEQVRDLVQSARSLQFDSINLDLIYGLPNQSVSTMRGTLEQVTQLRPERIALYGYAHLPERFKPQRRIHSEALPSAQEKSLMLQQAVTHLEKAGYAYIGMDHFALPNDPLAVAKRQGRLHRNFQGYSTMPDCDLVGLGVSAISKIGNVYSQNVKSLDEYYDHLARGKLPVERGLALSRDDLIRRAVIMAIMCQGQVNFESIELAYSIDFKSYFANEMTQLLQMQDDGLIVIEADGLTVTPQGWAIVRAVAMVFDRYLQTDRNRQRYSRII